MLCDIRHTGGDNYNDYTGGNEQMMDWLFMNTIMALQVILGIILMIILGPYCVICNILISQQYKQKITWRDFLLISAWDPKDK